MKAWTEMGHKSQRSSHGSGGSGGSAGSEGSDPHSEFAAMRASVAAKQASLLTIGRSTSRNLMR